MHSAQANVEALLAGEALPGARAWPTRPASP